METKRTVGISASEQLRIWEENGLPANTNPFRWISRAERKVLHAKEAERLKSMSLVKRLRKVRPYENLQTDGTLVSDLLKEAADRIDALEMQLAEAKQ
jgi:hypothetical protein